MFTFPCTVDALFWPRSYQHAFFYVVMYILRKVETHNYKWDSGSCSLNPKTLFVRAASVAVAISLVSAALAVTALAVTARAVIALAVTALAVIAPVATALAVVVFVAAAQRLEVAVLFQMFLLAVAVADPILALVSPFVVSPASIIHLLMGDMLWVQYELASR